MESYFAPPSASFTSLPPTTSLVEVADTPELRYLLKILYALPANDGTLRFDTIKRIMDMCIPLDAGQRIINDLRSIMVTQGNLSTIDRIEPVLRHALATQFRLLADGPVPTGAKLLPMYPGSFVPPPSQVPYVLNQPGLFGPGVFQPVQQYPGHLSHAVPMIANEHFSVPAEVTRNSGSMEARAKPFVPSQPVTPEYQRKSLALPIKDPKQQVGDDETQLEETSRKRSAAIPIKAPEDKADVAELKESDRTPLEKPSTNVPKSLPPGSSTAVPINVSVETTEATQAKQADTQNAKVPANAAEVVTAKVSESTNIADTQQTGKGSNLFEFLCATNIPVTLQPLDLQILFARHRGVVLRHVPGQRTAYVKFSSSDDAVKALAKSPLPCGRSTINLRWPIDDTVLKQSLADHKSLPTTAVLAANQTTRSKTVTVRIAPPSSQEVQTQASGISSSSKLGNATTLPALAPASSWAVQATPVDGHIQSDLLEFSSDAIGQGSSPAKASDMDIPSSPPVSTYSPEAKFSTPARTTSSKQNTVDSPGDLEGGTSRFLTMMKQGSVSRFMRQKYGHPGSLSQRMEASQAPHATTAVVTPLNILDLESPHDSISMSAMSSALEPTCGWRETNEGKSASQGSDVEDTALPPQETPTHMLEEAPELSFNPFGDQTEESDQRPSSQTSSQSSLTASIDIPIAAPQSPIVQHSEPANPEQTTAADPGPMLDNKIVEAPIDPEARDTTNIEANSVESNALPDAPESEIKGPGALTDVAIVSAADLTRIHTRVDSPQQDHAFPLFGSKLLRATSTPVTPVAQPQPPLILYSLNETLPWSVKHVDAALARRFDVHRYRIYEASIRGGFHDYRPEYLIQLHPSLALSTVLPLPNRLQLEIVGEGSGPDGTGYFGEMSRINTPKFCEFCHKTHRESRCGFVQLVTGTPSRSRQSSLTIADIVERIVRAKELSANVEESPEVHERPTLTFENSMVFDLDARAEEAQSTQPEDGVMPASSSDPISQGWSSPTLHTSDYTNVESIENEQLDSSLSADAETGVASVNSPVIAGHGRELAAGMPTEMDDAFVVMEMGEGGGWKEEMSLLD